MAVQSKSCCAGRKRLLKAKAAAQGESGCAIRKRLCKAKRLRKAKATVQGKSGCAKQKRLRKAQEAAQCNSGCIGQKRLRKAKATVQGTRGCTMQQRLHRAKATAQRKAAAQGKVAAQFESECATQSGYTMQQRLQLCAVIAAVRRQKQSHEVSQQTIMQIWLDMPVRRNETGTGAHRLHAHADTAGSDWMAQALPNQPEALARCT